MRPQLRMLSRYFTMRETELGMMNSQQSCVATRSSNRSRATGTEVCAQECSIYAASVPFVLHTCLVVPVWLSLCGFTCALRTL